MAKNFETTFPCHIYNRKVCEITVYGLGKDLGDDRELDEKEPDYPYRYEYQIDKMYCEGELVPIQISRAIMFEQGSFADSISKGIYEHLHMIFNPIK